MRTIREITIPVLAAALVGGTLACPPDRTGEPRTGGTQQGETGRTGTATGWTTGGREPAPGGGSTTDRPQGEPKGPAGTDSGGTTGGAGSLWSGAGGAGGGGH